MKRSSIFFAITILVLASMACNALSRIGNKTTNIQEQATEPVSDQTVETAAPPTSNDGGNTTSVDSGTYPMTDDAFNVTDMGSSGLVYFTKMSVDDVMKFYRDAYTAKGYTERKILTTTFEGGFSMVFDGDPSGKAIVIQSADMGDGSRTISITLADL